MASIGHTASQAVAHCWTSIHTACHDRVKSNHSRCLRLAAASCAARWCSAATRARVASSASSLQSLEASLSSLSLLSNEEEQELEFAAASGLEWRPLNMVRLLNGFGGCGGNASGVRKASTLRRSARSCVVTAACTWVAATRSNLTARSAASEHQIK